MTVQIDFTLFALPVDLYTGARLECSKSGQRGFDRLLQKASPKKYRTSAPKRHRCAWPSARDMSPYYPAEIEAGNKWRDKACLEVLGLRPALKISNAGPITFQQYLTEQDVRMCVDLFRAVAATRRWRGPDQRSRPPEGKDLN